MNFDRFKNEYLQKGTRNCGLVYGCLGALLALAFLFLGVLKTLFVAALFVVGYIYGSHVDGTAALKKTLRKMTETKETNETKEQNPD